MKWETLLDRDLLSLRFDPSDGSLLLEVNDGGLSPDYVTIRLGRGEVEEVRAAIEAYMARAR